MIRSFNGLTGKTNVIANLSYALACDGYKVGIADSDMAHTSLRIIYGLDDNQPRSMLQDFLLRKFETVELIHEVSDPWVPDTGFYFYLGDVDNIQNRYGLMAAISSARTAINIYRERSVFNYLPQLRMTVTVTNLDSEGGNFTVYGKVYEDNETLIHTFPRQTKYIYAGTSQDFVFETPTMDVWTYWDSESWVDRYQSYYNVIPPTTTVTTHTTKYETRYREESSTKRVNFIQYLLGTG